MGWRAKYEGSKLVEEHGQESLQVKSISDLQSGEIANVFGVVSSLISLPKSAVMKFSFEVTDQSGTICVTFLGRNSIVGINPGTQLKLLGRVTKDHKRLTMFNPRYTLVREDIG